MLDLLRGDPELLAIADAIASTQTGDRVRRPDAARRRWLRGSIASRVLHTASRRRRSG